MWHCRKKDKGPHLFNQTGIYIFDIASHWHQYKANLLYQESAGWGEIQRWRGRSLKSLNMQLRLDKLTMNNISMNQSRTHGEMHWFLMEIWERRQSNTEAWKWLGTDDGFRITLHFCARLNKLISQHIYYYCLTNQKKPTLSKRDESLPWLLWPLQSWAAMANISLRQCNGVYLSIDHCNGLLVGQCHCRQ